ncbi:MAG: tetratricopeptide repeat protein [candidate division Zixibacteria bacterium]|nr:tetratricopeptide repeat protein [candidate division Zixibacteria bacterium]
MIELDPHHPDAYYKLGRSYEFPSLDYEKAVSMFYRQIEETPSHREAIIHLARCFFSTDKYRDGLEQFDLLQRLHGDRLDSVFRILYLQVAAAAFQAEGPYDKAMDAYERHFEYLDARERALYHDFSFVASRRS